MKKTFQKIHIRRLQGEFCFPLEPFSFPSPPMASREGIDLPYPESDFKWNCQKFYEKRESIGTTEDTEKHSVSSRKKTKRQRHREVKNRVVGIG